MLFNNIQNLWIGLSSFTVELFIIAYSYHSHYNGLKYVHTQEDIFVKHIITDEKIDSIANLFFKLRSRVKISVVFFVKLIELSPLNRDKPLI
ncbi:hypothetical protein ALO79_200056 [Pseudomonas syringae pv. castaneae]|uniref:Conjugal transfer protein n=1 Tax=Pseudomonas syringae pv. castaneae TaxID=264450 RepID=A0A0N8R6G6_PSESX|nr:hypothetical protein ALO79_200056 [Pseudomonas syringae pv. castaneae]